MRLPKLDSSKEVRRAHSNGVLIPADPKTEQPPNAWSFGGWPGKVAEGVGLMACGHLCESGERSLTGFQFPPMAERAHSNGVLIPADPKTEQPPSASRFGGCSRKMAEGVGFEPTVTLLPRSISSRVPSTGLSHPSLGGSTGENSPGSGWGI